MTRSLSAIGHGEFAQAFEFHHLGPILFSFIVFQIPYRTWAIVIKPKRINKRIRKYHAVFAGVVLVAIIVNWFVYLGGRL
jgi:hypothetical protein